MFTTNGVLIWGVIASLYMANFLLLILNMPLVGLLGWGHGRRANSLLRL
jgi:TctA family transporter